MRKFICSVVRWFEGIFIILRALALLVEICCSSVDVCRNEGIALKMSLLAVEVELSDLLVSDEPLLTW